MKNLKELKNPCKCCYCEEELPKQPLKFAFTMAEILISLTIIGIIAAITLPALQSNINEKTWNTQRKALYSRMTQAISMMPALNGYGIGSTDAETIDNAANVFITDGLAKIIKINNVCDNSHLEDCGFTNKISTANGDIINIPKTLYTLNIGFGSDYDGQNPFILKNTKATAYETANGESILTFYNPECVSDMVNYNDSSVNQWFFGGYVCANFIYDLNGAKGPNQIGKDMGVITAFYPSDSVVVAPKLAPTKASESVTQPDASATCRAQNEDYRVPNIPELMSMYTNNKLYGLGNQTNGYYWSSKVLSDNKALAVSDYSGRIMRFNKMSSRMLYCLER